MWQVGGVARIEPRMGAWMAWVKLASPDAEETVPMDFRDQPTEQQVLAEAQRLVDGRNAPQEP